MRSSLRRIFSLFSALFVLLGISGINVTGAATIRYAVPSSPTNVKAVGGLEGATLTWKTPASNGGKTITSYKVAIFPGSQVHVCKSSSLRCVVDISNPNKPSAKPVPLNYAFTVAAVNSIGTGPASAKTAYVSVRFRATIYIAPKYGPATPSPTPTPTPSPTPTPTATIKPTPIPDSSPTFTPPYVTNAYDGSYAGTAVFTISSSLSTMKNVSEINTNFVVLAGRGSGRANNWSVDGYVTDPSGKASVTAGDSIYGSLTFTVEFAQDPVTKVMSGNGRGVRTFAMPGFGDVTVEFVFKVSKQG